MKILADVKRVLGHASRGQEKASDLLPVESTCNGAHRSSQREHLTTDAASDACCRRRGADNKHCRGTLGEDESTSGEAAAAVDMLRSSHLEVAACLGSAGLRRSP